MQAEWWCDQSGPPTGVLRCAKSRAAPHSEPRRYRSSCLQASRPHCAEAPCRASRRHSLSSPGNRQVAEYRRKLHHAPHRMPERAYTHPRRDVPKEPHRARWHAWCRHRWLLCRFPPHCTRQHRQKQRLSQPWWQQCDSYWQSVGLSPRQRECRTGTQPSRRVRQEPHRALQPALGKLLRVFGALLPAFRVPG